MMTFDDTPHSPVRQVSVAAALELAIRQPEVRARGRLQRQLIARARGLA
jgi:hypothetical protein